MTNKYMSYLRTDHTQAQEWVAQGPGPTVTGQAPGVAPHCSEERGERNPRIWGRSVTVTSR